MAALHTLHRAGQRLGVLARGGTGGTTAVVAPLTLVPALPEIPLLAGLGCGDGRNEHNHGITGCPVPPEKPGPPPGPKPMAVRPAVVMALGEVTGISGN